MDRENNIVHELAIRPCSDKSAQSPPCVLISEGSETAVLEVSAFAPARYIARWAVHVQQSGYTGHHG